MILLRPAATQVSSFFIQKKRLSTSYLFPTTFPNKASLSPNVIWGRLVDEIGTGLVRSGEVNIPILA